jgi:hypothetical protein
VQFKTLQITNYASIKVLSLFRFSKVLGICFSFLSPFLEVFENECSYHVSHIICSYTSYYNAMHTTDIQPLLLTYKPNSKIIRISRTTLRPRYFYVTYSYIPKEKS